MKPLSLASVSLLVLALTGCTVMPTGPSVTVLPGSTKSFEQFRYDDVNCRQYAHMQVGGANEAVNQSAVGSAVVGTAIGALAGAALGGNHEWRITWFRRITVVFLGDVLRQTLLNLRRDGSLWKWSTWTSAARTLFGKGGLVRETWRPWREYLRPDFHPSQHGTDLSARWLAEHSNAYTLVGAR